jgi:hypothetical protein
MTKKSSQRPWWRRRRGCRCAARLPIARLGTSVCVALSRSVNHSRAVRCVLRCTRNQSKGRLHNQGRVQNSKFGSALCHSCQLDAWSRGREGWRRKILSSEQIAAQFEAIFANSAAQAKKEKMKNRKGAKRKAHHDEGRAAPAQASRAHKHVGATDAALGEEGRPHGAVASIMADLGMDSSRGTGRARKAKSVRSLPAQAIDRAGDQSRDCARELETKRNCEDEDAAKRAASAVQADKSAIAGRLEKKGREEKRKKQVNKPRQLESCAPYSAHG